MAEQSASSRDVEQEPVRAVSLRGRPSYGKAVREFADQKGEHVGDIVRRALDAAYGPELDRLVIFFDQLEDKNTQMSTEGSEHVA
jgi:hypothetical protein